MKLFFNIRALYFFRHVFALIAMLVSIYIIKTVTIKLYLNLEPHLSLKDTIYILWKTQKLFYRFLVIINFVIKPAFIYYLTLVIFYLSFKRKL